MAGTLTYWVPDGEDRLKLLRLTVCSLGGTDCGGVTHRRRERVRMLVEEAALQGARLGYGDLAMILLASKATLKRDVSYLRRVGFQVPIGRMV
jgi:hypothetical protein